MTGLKHCALVIVAFACCALFGALNCAVGEVPPPPPQPGMPAVNIPMPPSMGAPAGAPGEQGAAADQKEEPRVKVFLDQDVIYTRDGNELKGTVIMVAAKSTIILTEKGEQMVPRENIEKIALAKDQAEKPTTLPVRTQDGFKFIVMEPIEDAAAPPSAGGQANPAAGGKQPAPHAAAPAPAAPKPAPAVKPKDDGARPGLVPQPFKKSPVAPKFAPDGDGGLKKLDAAEVKRLMEAIKKQQDGK